MTTSRLRDAAILAAVLLLAPPGAARFGNAAPASDGTYAVPATERCGVGGSATCAAFADGSGGKHSIELFSGNFTLVDASLMGSYQIAGGLHQLAYIYGTINTPQRNGIARVSIVDLTAAEQIAWVASPPGYDVDGTYFDYIREPGGEKHPFIAPGVHRLTSHAASPNGTFDAPPWNFMCVFDLNYIDHPDPACNIGFKHYNTSFITAEGVADVKASGFRHGGGWVEDVDGDGWDDINLPFLGYILTISGRTGQKLSLAHFDVAAQSEPNAPPYFHSGRFYGRFATFTEPATGRHDVLFTDGEGAGYFGGLYCGVSRYVAVAQWTPGPSLKLKWSDYLSFTKTVFKPPYRSLTDVARRGDDLNNCPHYFSTGLEWLGGRPLVVFSLFGKDNPAPACQTELLAEQKSHFDKLTSATYEYRCAPKEMPAASGRWSIRILDALTGKNLADYPNLYAWGDAPNVLPGMPQTLLVQQLTSNGGEIAYNRMGYSADALTLVQLAAGPSLKIVATVVNPSSVPIVTGVLEYGKNGNMGGGPAQPTGVGSSYEGVSRLVIKDIDGDGLNDIKLKNGKWLGYSLKEGKLIEKRIKMDSTFERSSGIQSED